MGVLLVTGILKEITCLQAVADDEACKYGYESWIAYCYKTNIFTRFITICPCCKKCNDRFKNNQAWKVFKVRGYHLCQVPNKPPKR